MEWLCWVVYFQLHLCKLGPPLQKLLPNVILLFLLIKHTLLLSFFSHFSPYPSQAQHVGGGTMKNISKISKTLNI